jgi:hypothetical protein
VSRHAHRFETYVGLPLYRVGQRRLAWVREAGIAWPGPSEDAPRMLRCACGEQGYEVRG